MSVARAVSHAPSVRRTSPSSAFFSSACLQAGGGATKSLRALISVGTCVVVGLYGTVEMLLFLISGKFQKLCRLFILLITRSVLAAHFSKQRCRILWLLGAAGWRW